MMNCVILLFVHNFLLLKRYPKPLYSCNLLTLLLVFAFDNESKFHNIILKMWQLEQKFYKFSVAFFFFFLIVVVVKNGDIPVHKKVYFENEKQFRLCKITTPHWASCTVLGEKRWNSVREKKSVNTVTCSAQCIIKGK